MQSLDTARNTATHRNMVNGHPSTAWIFSGGASLDAVQVSMLQALLRAGLADGGLARPGPLDVPLARHHHAHG